MLEAANWAPTHGKTEPWRFVVLGKAASQEMLELSAKVHRLSCTSLQRPSAERGACEHPL